MEAQRGGAVCPKSHSIWNQISLIQSAVIVSSLVSSQAGWGMEVGSKLAPGGTEGAESWGTQAEAISHSFSRCLASTFTVHQLWS